MGEKHEEHLLQEIAESLQRIECELRDPTRVEITLRIVLEEPKHYHPTIGGTIRVE